MQTCCWPYQPMIMIYNPKHISISSLKQSQVWEIVNKFTLISMTSKDKKCVWDFLTWINEKCWDVRDVSLWVLMRIDAPVFLCPSALTAPLLHHIYSSMNESFLQCATLKPLWSVFQSRNLIWNSDVNWINLRPANLSVPEK